MPDTSGEPGPLGTVSRADLAKARNAELFAVYRDDAASARRALDDLHRRAHAQTEGLEPPPCMSGLDRDRTQHDPGPEGGGVEVHISEPYAHPKFSVTPGCRY